MKRNDYGSLCTEMYEILHPQACLLYTSDAADE